MSTRDTSAIEMAVAPKHNQGGYCSLCDEMERALAALQAALEERTSERNVLRSLCGELWDERQELQADLLDGQVPLF